LLVFNSSTAQIPRQRYYRSWWELTSKNLKKQKNRVAMMVEGKNKEMH
jgi:hypothetical protein